MKLITDSHVFFCLTHLKMVEKSSLIDAIMESARHVSDGKIKGTRNIHVMKCFHVHFHVLIYLFLSFFLYIFKFQNTFLHTVPYNH